MILIMKKYHISIGVFQNNQYLGYSHVNSGEMNNPFLKSSATHRELGLWALIIDSELPFKEQNNC